MSWMRQKQREAAGEQTMGFRSKVSRDLVGTEPSFQLGIAAPLIKQKHRKKRALCFQFREQYNKQA